MAEQLSGPVLVAGICVVLGAVLLSALDPRGPGPHHGVVRVVQAVALALVLAGAVVLVWALIETLGAEPRR